MREEIRNIILSRRGSPVPASDPNQASKRQKETGKFTPNGNNGFTPPAGGENPPPAATILPAPPAGTERAPSFSFPINFSAQPNTKQAQTDAQIFNEALRQAINPLGQTLNQQKEKEKISLSPMGPPPPRPPREKSPPAGAPGVPSAVPNTQLNTHNHHHHHRHHQIDNHHHNPNNANNNNNNQTPPSSSPTPTPTTPGTRGSATETANGTNITTPTTTTTNQKTSLNLEKAVDLQQQVTALHAVSQLRENQLAKLAAVNVAAGNAIQSMKYEWQNLVAMMQGAVREQTARLNTHSDSIQVVEDKVKNNTDDILALNSRMNMMSESMDHLLQVVEGQDVARRTFEANIFSILVPEQGQNNHPVAAAAAAARQQE